MAKQIPDDDFSDIVGTEVVDDDFSDVVGAGQPPLSIMQTESQGFFVPETQAVTAVAESPFAGIQRQINTVSGRVSARVSKLKQLEKQLEGMKPKTVDPQTGAWIFDTQDELQKFQQLYNQYKQEYDAYKSEAERAKSEVSSLVNKAKALESDPEVANLIKKINEQRAAENKRLEQERQWEIIGQQPSIREGGAEQTLKGKNAIDLLLATGGLERSDIKRLGEYLSTSPEIPSAIGRGAVEGIAVEIPRMVGQAAEYLGTRVGQVSPPISAVGTVGGKKIQEFADTAQEALFGEPPEYSGIAKHVYEGSKMLAPSVLPAGAAGGIARATLAGVKSLNALQKAQIAARIAGLTSGALFGASQAQSVIQSAKERGVDPGMAPEIEGAIEALGEYVGTRYLAKLLGLDENALKVTLRNFIKSLGVENTTEFLQQLGQSATDIAYGIRKGTLSDALDDAIQVIGPTTFMTVMTGGVGKGAEKLAPVVEKAIQNIKRKEAQGIELNQAERNIKRQHPEIFAEDDFSDVVAEGRAGLPSTTGREFANVAVESPSPESTQRGDLSQSGVEISPVQQKPIQEEIPARKLTEEETDAGLRQVTPELTREEKRALVDAGFTVQEVNEMKPEEAKAILGTERTTQEGGATKEARKGGERIVSAVAIIGGKEFTGKTHGETLQKAIDAGEVIEKNGRYYDKEGNDLWGSGWNDLFKTNTGEVIDRFEASMRFNISGAEDIPKSGIESATEGTGKPTPEGGKTPKEDIPINTSVKYRGWEIRKEPSGTLEGKYKIYEPERGRYDAAYSLEEARAIIDRVIEQRAGKLEKPTETTPKTGEALTPEQAREQGYRRVPASYVPKEGEEVVDLRNERGEYFGKAVRSSAKPTQEERPSETIPMGIQSQGMESTTPTIPDDARIFYFSRGFGGKKLLIASHSSDEARIKAQEILGTKTPPMYQEQRLYGRDKRLFVGREIIAANDIAQEHGIRTQVSTGGTGEPPTLLKPTPKGAGEPTIRTELKYQSRPDFQRKFGSAEIVGYANGRGIYYYKGKLYRKEESIAGSWGKMVEVFPEEITSWRNTKTAFEVRGLVKPQPKKAIDASMPYYEPKISQSAPEGASERTTRYDVGDEFTYQGTRYKIQHIGLSHVTAERVGEKSALAFIMNNDQFRKEIGELNIPTQQEYSKRIEFKNLADAANNVRFMGGLRGGDYIEKRISEGYTQIDPIKVGSVTKYYLTNPKTNQQIPISGALRRYAEAILKSEKAKARGGETEPIPEGTGKPEQAVETAKAEEREPTPEGVKPIVEERHEIASFKKKGTTLDYQNGVKRAEEYIERIRAFHDTEAEIKNRIIGKIADIEKQIEHLDKTERYRKLTAEHIRDVESNIENLRGQLSRLKDEIGGVRQDEIAKARIDNAYKEIEELRAQQNALTESNRPKNQKEAEWNRIQERINAIKAEIEKIRQGEKPSVNPVREIPLSEIDVEPERFQPRLEGIDEELQQQRLKSFDRRLTELNPIKVWKDPKDGRYKVLAGHHRYDLFTRRGEKTIPAIEFVGTFEEARDYAFNEQAQAKSQTIIDRANYYRLQREKGVQRKDIEEEAQRLEGRNAHTAIVLSYLNPKGKAFIALKSLGTETESGREALTMASWIGQIRKSHPELTDSHENEIFDFLKNNYKTAGKKFTSSAQFREFIDKVIDRRTVFGVFEADRPLNFGDLIPKSATELQYESRIAEARRLFNEAQEAVAKKRASLVERGASEQRIAEILKPLEDMVKVRQKELSDLILNEDKAKNEIRKQEMSLFEQIDEVQEQKRNEGVSDEQIDSAKPSSDRYAEHRDVETVAGESEEAKAKGTEGDILRQLTEEHTSSENFKRWFNGSKVVDENGKPKMVFSGHQNVEIYGSQYDPKRGTAGAFYATESPEVASAYALGKFGAKEHFENGEQYRIQAKNGKFTKKLWQVQLTDEQKRKWDEFSRELNEYGEPKHSGAYHYLQWARDNKDYDPLARRILADPYNLHNFWRFNEEMGYNLVEPAQGDEPYFMRQRKNETEEMMDALGIRWQSYEWSQPGVLAVFMSIKNPIDTSKPFPKDVLAALEQAAKRTRRLSEQEIIDRHWTGDYPLRNWVEDIKKQEETGEETYWATQVPRKAIPILKRFGYDGIKDVGGKARQNPHTVWVAFDPQQIKSAIGNNGQFDPTNADILKKIREQESVIRQRRIEDTLSNLSPEARQNVIVTTRANAPEALRQSIGSTTKGIFHNGKVYLFENADERTLLHELLGHYNLYRLFGDKLNPFLDKLWTDREAAIKNASWYNRYVREDPTNYNPNTERGRRNLANEYVAHLAEYRDRTTWEKLIAWLRSALRSIAPNLKWTDAELKKLIADGYREMQKREGRQIPSGAPIFQAPLFQLGGRKFVATAIKVGDNLYRGNRGEMHADIVMRMTEDQKASSDLETYLTSPRSNREFDGFLDERGEFVSREEASRIAKQELASTDILRQIEGRGVTSTPEFKRWFGESKVVDENGEPLGVYHGTAKYSYKIESPEVFRTPAFFSEDPNAAYYYTASQKHRNLMKVFLSIKQPFYVPTDELGVISFVEFWNSSPGSTEEKIAAWNESVRRQSATATLGQNPGSEITLSPEIVEKVMGLIDRFNIKNSTNAWLKFDSSDRFREELEKNDLQVEQFDDSLFDNIAAFNLFSRQGEVSSFQSLLQKYGYDGARYLDPISKRGKISVSNTWVAFYPTQIKSATGNRGTFDIAEPSILRQLEKSDTEILSRVKPIIESTGGYNVRVNSSLGKPIVYFEHKGVKDAEGNSIPTTFARLPEEVDTPEKINKIVEQKNEEYGLLRQLDEGIEPTDDVLSPQAQENYERMKKNLNSVKVRLLEILQDNWVRVDKLIQQEGIVTESNPYVAKVLYAGRVQDRMDKIQKELDDIDKDVLKTAKAANIDDATLWRDVHTYLHAVHAPERNAVHGERASGLSDAEANALLEELRAKPEFGEIQRIAKRLAELNRRGLDILLDGGLISEERYRQLRELYPNHVPLNRIMDDTGIEQYIAGGEGFNVYSSGLKRAKGSEREVADIAANIATNLSTFTIRAEKNLVDLATLKFARDNKDLGLFEEIKPKAIGKRWDGSIIFQEIHDPLVLRLYEDGKPVYLRIKDANLARAFQNINIEKLSLLDHYASIIGRFYASLATRFNPGFWPSNKIRDLQELIPTIAATKELGVKGAFKAVKRDVLLENVRAVTEYLMGKDTEGARLYAQMKADGGTTGGLALSTRRDIEVNLEKLKKLNRSNPKKALHYIAETVDNINQIFEDSTRLSVYRTALEAGLTRQQAAFHAKNSTIDFNRKGTAGGIINAWWIFANPSIQGSVKMLRAMKNPKVAVGTVLSVGTAVFLVSLWNDAIDKDWRDKVSKWDKLNGLPILVPSSDGIRYFTLPVSWALKPIKVIADRVIELASVGATDAKEAISDMLTSIIDGYNPLGGTDVVSALTPTVLDLPVDLARNRSWTGGMIHPEYGKKPKYTVYFKSLEKSPLGRGAIATAKALDDIGIEVSPADIKYTVDNMIGGTGRFISQMISTAASIASGELPRAREIPFVSRFYRDIPSEEMSRFRSDLRAISEQETKVARLKVKALETGNMFDVEAYQRAEAKLKDMREKSPAYQSLLKERREKKKAEDIRLGKKPKPKPDEYERMLEFEYEK